MIVVTAILEAGRHALPRRLFDQVREQHPGWGADGLVLYVLDDDGAPRRVIAPPNPEVSVGDEIVCFGSWGGGYQTVTMSAGAVEREVRGEFVERVELAPRE